MKLLKNLNDSLIPPKKNHDKNDVPLIKDVLIDNLKFSKPKNGKESIKLNRLAEKIFDSLDELKIEDYEFEILVEKMNENGAMYYTWAHSQVMEKLIIWSKNE